MSKKTEQLITYYNDKGHCVVDSSDNICAYKMALPSGKFRYYAKVAKFGTNSGNLFNPIGEFATSKTQLYDMKQVKEECFVYYVDFLKNRRQFSFSQAQKELKYG